MENNILKTLYSIETEFQFLLCVYYLNSYYINQDVYLSFNYFKMCTKLIVLWYRLEKISCDTNIVISTYFS